jgi:hypothetical protein
MKSYLLSCILIINLFTAGFGKINFALNGGFGFPNSDYYYPAYNARFYTDSGRQFYEKIILSDSDINNFSLGNGIKINLEFIYFFKDNFGIELNTGYSKMFERSSGTYREFNYKDTIDYTFSKYNTGLLNSSHFPISLGLIFQTNFDKPYNFYFGLAAFYPLFSTYTSTLKNIEETDTLGNRTGETFDIEEYYTMRNYIGQHWKLGAKIKIYKSAGLDLRFFNISARSKILEQGTRIKGEEMPTKLFYVTDDGTYNDDNTYYDIADNALSFDSFGFNLGIFIEL